MTFEEALGVLGIDSSVARADVRRAYLRLLRKHKPEADPAGFVRLREAFELVQGRFEWGLGLPLPTPPPLDPPADAPLAPLLEPDGDPAPRVKWVDAPNVMPPRPAATDPVGRCLEKLDSIPFEAVDERLGLLRDLVRDLPAAPEGHWRLAEELEAVDRRAEAADVYRAAHRLGLVGFREELLARYFDLLTTEEVTDAISHASPARLADLAPGLIERGMVDEAARAAISAVERCTASTDLQGPSPWSLIDTMLALHEKGRPAQAREVEARWATWLSETGEESRWLGDRLAALWAIVQELGALPFEGEDALAPEVRRCIARAARSGDLLDAEPALRELVAREPEIGKVAARALVAHAPILDRALAEVLDPELRMPNVRRFPQPYDANRSTYDTPKASGTNPSMYVIFVVIAMFLGRNVVRCASHSSPLPDQETLQRLTRPLPDVPPSLLDDVPANVDLSDASRAAESFCQSGRDDETCRGARSVVRSMLDHRCWEAQQRESLLRLTRTRGQPERDLVEALESALQRACAIRP